MFQNGCYTEHNRLTNLVLQKHKSTLHLKVVKECQKNVSDFNLKIVFIYAKEVTIRQISGALENIYSFEKPEGFILDVIDGLLPQTKN